MYREETSKCRKIANPFRTRRNRLPCPPRNSCSPWAGQNSPPLQFPSLPRVNRPRWPAFRRHWRPSRLSLLLSPHRRAIRRTLWPGCRKVQNRALFHRWDVRPRPRCPRLLARLKSRPDLCASLIFRPLLAALKPLHRPRLLHFSRQRQRRRRRLFHRRWQRRRRRRSRRPNLHRCLWLRQSQNPFSLSPSLRPPPLCRRLHPPFRLFPSRPSARSRL